MMTDAGAYSDSDILELIRRGDRGAMKILYDRYSGCLAAVCARYVADEDDRKDVLQDSFIKIFGAVGRFELRGEGSLRSWMIRITVNEALRFLRRDAAYDFITCASELPDTPEEPDIDNIPDDVINDMILSMPSGYRAVFNLYVFERKSHKEIAALLGIGESSSASQFSRARSWLVKRVNEYKEAHKND